MKDRSIGDVCYKLVRELNAVGVECYVWHKADTGSCYIRFKDNRIGSIRIGDHNGIEKYKYKYNLRSDISPKHKQWVKDGDIWRFYLPINKWKDIIPVLQERLKAVQSWEKGKYEYGIPSFKKELINNK